MVEREGAPVADPWSFDDASDAELDEAVCACDLPFFVAGLPDGIVRIVNPAFEQLVGVPASELIGRRTPDLFSPHDAAELWLAALESGAVDAVRASRRIPRPDGHAVAVWVWVRVTQAGSQRAFVALVVPAERMRSTGKDTSAPWRELAEVAVGTADAQWRIEQVSADVRSVTGRDAAALTGTPLLDLVHVDPPPVLSQQAAVTSARGQVVPAVGPPIDVRLLLARLGDTHSGRVVFALMRPLPARALPSASDRIAELELRLRRIGAEVQAAGVLDEIGALPAPGEIPELGDLTSRQWEILSRLVGGERVRTIATALYLNPSTIRNHLTAIFRKFGVHSQAELLRRVRRDTPLRHG
jgi:PAS domain S-box-containing protein